MITTNTTYNNLIANGAAYEWRVVNGSNTWTKENLISGKLASTLFERVSIGNAISSQLDLQLRNVSVDQNSPVVLQFRATQNDGASVSPWYTKGTYYLDTVESSPYSEITKITAFDALIKAEITYMLKGTWSGKLTTLQVMNSIAADIGVSVDATTSSYIQANQIVLTASPNIGTDGTTKRQMLGYIAAMYGGNFRINASNRLQLVRINVAASNTAAVGDAVKDFDASEKETIGKVRIWDDGSTYYAEPGLPLLTEAGEPILTEKNEPILIYAGQFLDEWEAIEGQVLDAELGVYASLAMAERIYNMLDGVSYQPFTCPFAFVDPKYEVGDGISIKDITSVIGNMETNITPLAPSKVDFGKTEVLNNKYTYRPSFQRSTTYQLATIPEKVATEVQTQTTLMMGGFGGYIKFTYLADKTPSEMLIMDSDTEAGSTSIIRLNKNGIGFSTDGGKTYKNAWTIDGHLSADFIDVGTLDASKATITNISATNITTGTLSANRIAANSIAVSKLTGSISNGNWKIDLDAGTFTIGNISASNITTGTLDANKITVSNLSASSITTGTLNGDNVSITNLKAGNIVSGTIQDKTGKNYWNLDTGVFNTQQGVISGFAIDETGLSTAAMAAGGGSVIITPYHIRVWGSSMAVPQQMASLQNGHLQFFARDASDPTQASTLIICGNIESGTDENLGNKYITINNGGTTGSYAGITLQNGTVKITGNLDCTGTASSKVKQRRINTEDYGTRGLYCYETPSAMFGDIGEGVIGDDSTAYVWLDPIFTETIDTSQYQVSLTPYGAGECYISERKGAYFIVKGEPNLAFGWEIKAKQFDLVGRRLDAPIEAFMDSEDYGYLAIQHLEELYQERTAA